MGVIRVNSYKRGGRQVRGHARGRAKRILKPKTSGKRLGQLQGLYGKLSRHIAAEP